MRINEKWTISIIHLLKTMVENLIFQRDLRISSAVEKDDSNSVHDPFLNNKSYHIYLKLLKDRVSKYQNFVNQMDVLTAVTKTRGNEKHKANIKYKVYYQRP